MIPQLTILRIVGWIVLAAALMAAGAAIDHHLYVVPVQAEINRQEGADAQASHDAQLVATKQENTQDEATTRALQYYAGLSGNLNDALARMRQQPARAHVEYLPASAVSASGVDGAIGEQGGTVPSSGVPTGCFDINGASCVYGAESISSPYTTTECFGTDSDPCLVKRHTYEGALKDAVKVEGWQDWAIRQGFPVEEHPIKPLSLPE